MTNTPKPVALPIKSLRIICGAMASALVMFGFVMYLDLPSTSFPPIWVLVALGGLAVISHLMSRMASLNIKAVPAGTVPAEAMKMALATFQTVTLLKFALSEAVAIIALVLSFIVTPMTWMTYLVGGVLAGVLIAVNVWPSGGCIAKAQAQLDRDGGQSFLGDALFGLTPGTTSSAVIYS